MSERISCQVRRAVLLDETLADPVGLVREIGLEEEPEAACGSEEGHARRVRDGDEALEHGEVKE